MSGLAAFTTKLMSGQRQVETATVACPTGAITGSGNIDATMDSALLAGGTEVVAVAVLLGDTPQIVAQKIVAALNLNADFNADFIATVDGANVVTTTLLAAANEAGQNLGLAVDDAAGMTAAPTSTNTVAGIAYTEIANATAPVGPALSLDTEDTTTHDSTDGFEECVPTILRTGEMKLDINYDPDNATHDGSTGILYRHVNKLLGAYQLRFPDAGNTMFSFDAYVSSFEPSEPVDGKISAAVAFKVTGVPVLTDSY
jgi:hypothetical protein